MMRDRAPPIRRPGPRRGARIVRRGPSFAGAQFERFERRELRTEAEAAVPRRARRYGPEGARPRWAMPERRARRGAGPLAYRPAAMSRYCFTIAFAFFSRRLIRECIQPSV